MSRALTERERKLLKMVTEFPGLSFTELAGKFRPRWSPQTVSRYAQSLADLGHVEIDFSEPPRKRVNPTKKKK